MFRTDEIVEQTVTEWDREVDECVRLGTMSGATAARLKEEFRSACSRIIRAIAEEIAEIQAYTKRKYGQ